MTQPSLCNMQTRTMNSFEPTSWLLCTPSSQNWISVQWCGALVFSWLQQQNATTAETTVNGSDADFLQENYTTTRASQITRRTWYWDSHDTCRVFPTGLPSIATWHTCFCIGNKHVNCDDRGSWAKMCVFCHAHPNNWR